MKAEPVTVVGVIIERAGRFLIGKRSLHKESAPGVWHAVTGRVEPGESQAAAVVREVAEETGLACTAREKIGEAITRDGSACIHWWRVALSDDADALLLGDEHSELRWVSIEEMRRLEPIFPEDVERFARLSEGTRR
jgi:8-oxo-dGTP diphosphatase